jgi:hypothetical protein
LQGCTVLGLVDDDHVLAARDCNPSRNKTAPARLFLYRPADGTETEIALPAGVTFSSIQVIAPLNRWGSLLDRDPAGRIWLHNENKLGKSPLLLDTATNQVTKRGPLAGFGWHWPLIDWPDANSVVLLDGARIVRIDLTTNATTQLFPRAQ